MLTLQKLRSHERRSVAHVCRKQLCA